MADCSGNCENCGGCAKELVMTPGEVQILNMLGQLPFLPVARKADTMIPVCLEEGLPEESSLLLQILEKKGLIDIDYRQPLKGFDMSAYQGLPVHGSFALTARGQQVLDMLQIQGITEE